MLPTSAKVKVLRCGINSFGTKITDCAAMYIMLPLFAMLLFSACASPVGPENQDIISDEPLVETSAEFSLATVFPKATGWSADGLEVARQYADSVGSTAVIAIHDGHLVAEWGATARRISGHSIRKSLMSALYGIAVDRGLIDISKTLEELGIDDKNPPLSQQEKQARLVDLLTSRSGIYHSSIQDSDPNHPQPGSHPPDTYFYYNNWSFNALGTIFEQLVGQSMGDAFKEWIADPIGMQDFQAHDVIYEDSHESVFPAYRFWMTGRDFARFGVLYLQQGNWKGNQIISADWVRESTTKYSDVGQFGYGYMWWTLHNGVYLASGTGGQKILVDPANKLVVVNRVDTGKGASRAWWIENGRSVNNTEFLEISRRIMEAAPTM